MKTRTVALRSVAAVLVLFSVALVLAATHADAAPESTDPLSRIEMPEGFSFSYFAKGVRGARSMTLGAKGTLFVGTRRPGVVYAIRDEDGDGKADRVRTIARVLNSPNGVAFRDGALYVAEIHRILRYDRIEERLDEPPEPVVVRDDLPRDRHHGWKFIAFGPDGLLYVPIGAPGNVVLRKDDPRYASICRMKPDGTGFEVFAHGVRNTVGFDWNPGTKVLWFTDNGRDWMGDDSPPDELNRAASKDLHFGYPFRHGRSLADPEFGEQSGDRKFVAPEVELGPHVAALGMRFYRGTMFPEAYRGTIFIAEHGSWNRTDPIGYRLSIVSMRDGKPTDDRPFATGWLKDGEAWGRPVDVQELADGSLLVSDDKAGAIYRITYSK